MIFHVDSPSFGFGLMLPCYLFFSDYAHLLRVFAGFCAKSVCQQPVLIRRYHVGFGSLKSPTSYRTVPLIPELEAILLPMRGADHEQIVSGKKLMSDSAYARAWQRIQKKIELYDSTAHVYRHTFATFALDDIDPKLLQAVLGHSDFSTTMNTYVHARKDKMKGLHQTLNGMYQRAG